MRRTLAVIGLACLAGCAVQTPATLRAQEPAVALDSERSPLAAAQCMGRNAEAWDGPLIERFSAPWRDAGGGAYELVVQMLPGGVQVAVGEATPRDTGSRVRVWQHPHFIHPELAGVMAKGC